MMFTEQMPSLMVMQRGCFGRCRVDRSKVDHDFKGKVRPSSDRSFQLSILQIILNEFVIEILPKIHRN